jgi:hypothetical protein
MTTTRPREALSEETNRAQDTSLLPTFLVIGATKGGTTSLYHYLDQHPDIYMSHPVKEPKFFTAEEGSVVRENGAKGWHVSAGHITKLADYQALFRGATAERARGEASPQYLYYPEVPERIHRRLPEVELIAILRHPVARAYSAFLHQTRDGMEPQTNFAAALADEPRRIAEGWSPLYHYRAQGFYHEQLSRYYRLFDPAKIHVYLYDDLQKDPLGLMQRIYRDVGVDAAFRPSLEVQHNISGVPKNRALHSVHAFLKPAQGTRKTAPARAVSRHPEKADGPESGKTQPRQTRPRARRPGGAAGGLPRGHRKTAGADRSRPLELAARPLAERR